MPGSTVLTANSGHEAVAVCEQNKDRMALVVLDYVLPGMTGAEIFDRIRTIRDDARVLVAGGYGNNGKAGELLHRGGGGHIQKPYTILEISRKIRDVLAPTTKGSEPAIVSSLPPPACPLSPYSCSPPLLRKSCSTASTRRI